METRDEFVNDGSEEIITIMERINIFTNKDEGFSKGRIMDMRLVEMVIKLALIDPEVLKIYKIIKGDKIKLEDNNITRAWLAVYNILGGLYKHVVEDGDIVWLDELKDKIAKDKAMNDSDDDDESIKSLNSM